MKRENIFVEEKIIYKQFFTIQYILCLASGNLAQEYKHCTILYILFSAKYEHNYFVIATEFQTKKISVMENVP